jgi:hypothetical protein
MKATLQSLFRSLLLYGFFFILYAFLLIGAAEEIAKSDGLSANQFLTKFWHDYQWLLILPHALFILAFIIVQERINWINRHPPALSDKQLKEQQQRANIFVKWVAGPATVFGLLSLTGLAFIFSGLQYSVGFPVALFLLYLLLFANGLSTLGQNYQHYLRKRSAKTVEQVLAENKAPILYLRSFVDDEIAAKIEASILTEEELLNKAFEHIGPLIAIGRPGEALPEVGAARAYFTDDQWQTAVQHYMDISRLIVLRAGLSPGLIWEIQNSVHRLDPSKLILLIPLEKNAYDQFRTRVQVLFPRPLPDHPGHNAHRTPEKKTEKGMKYGSLLGLIYFDNDWTAHFEKISADNIPHEYEMIGSQYAVEMMYLMIHYALRPVYANLGLAWDDLRLPWKNNQI